MRRNYIGFGLITIIISALASCSKIGTIDNDKPDPEVVESKVFYAVTPKDTLTKSYIDSDLNILWTADDRLSVFRGAANEQYRYTGESGQDEGEFEKVSGDAPASFYPHNYGIYPYAAGNYSTTESAISITLPATQTYAANSFGPGANTMAAVTSTADDNTFKFKNVCGYILLKVYGGDIIRRIVFRGNNGEKIAGSATLTASYGETPAVAMSDLSTTEITLDCGDDGVATGATEDECTNFWMVVPPTTFTGGFTVEITNTVGRTVTKTTSKNMSITRNVIQPMAAIKVDTQGDNDLLSFSLSDGPNTYDAFDISNGYVNVQVPNGTDMTNMTATFTHNGASVSVNGVTQTSGTGTHDFSDFVNPITYTVISRSGIENPYIIRMFDLPVVIASTPDNVPITSKTVWTEGCSFVIRESDGTVTDYGNTSLKGRGNLTWTAPKKPYAIKFSNKQEVLGMPSDKRWVLLAGYYDRTDMRNDMAFEISRKTNSLDWTPRGMFVELIFNGEFRGNYYICEKIKISSDRVAIKELSGTETDPDIITGGYILEYDSHYNGSYKFKTGLDFPVNFYSPDDNVCDVQFNYIEEYLAELENSLTDEDRLSTREYLNYIDIDSFADWWLVMEMLQNQHETSVGGPRSCYFYKDRGGKLVAGPVWDQDVWTFRLYQNTFLVNNALYYKYLFKDSFFVSRVKEKWPGFKTSLLESPSIIDYYNSQYASIYNSILRDGAMWPITGSTRNQDESLPVETACARLPLSISYRINALDDLISNLSVTYDGKSGGNEDYGDQDDQTGNFNFDN